jgi:hypothetical protein
MSGMQPTNPNLAKYIGWIAGVSAICVAIILPLVFFTLSYQNQVGALDAEAEINSRLASQVINANPEMWRFQELKLGEFLKRRPRHGHPEIRRIFDNQRYLIAESVDALDPPLLTESADILDSGVRVGYIEISRSLRPLIFKTAGIFVLSSALAGAIFVVFRTLPLRALNRALADNVRFVGEITAAKENLEKANATLITQAAELTHSNKAVQERYEELRVAHDMRRTTEET